MNVLNSLVGTVAPVSLQLEPSVREALSNPLLSSSLWIMIVLMGVATLLFVYMGRNVGDPRVQLMFIATIGIPAVSISSYLGLASGLTIGVVEISGRGETVTLWGRYLTWTFSTPLILLALGVLAGSHPTKIATAIVFDVLMCVTGLAAALTTQAVWLRWFWFLISSAFFAVVLYVLLIEWPQDALERERDIQGLFGTLRNLTAVLWVGYPLVWAIGSEGLALFGTGMTGVAVTSWLYSLLDVGAKFAFAFLLLRFLSDEPASAQSQAYLGSPTSADD